MRLVLQALRDIDVRGLLPEIAAPTLILHRKEDAAVRVEAGRYLADHLPASKFIELDGRDHWWWVSDVNPIVDYVKRFVRQMADPSA